MPITWVDYLLPPKHTLYWYETYFICSFFFFAFKLLTFFKMEKEFIELEAAIDPSTLPPPKRKHPTLVVFILPFILFVSFFPLSSPFLVVIYWQVCTKSLLEQWKEEAIKRTKPNTFKICIHHGTDCVLFLRMAWFALLR